MVFQDRPYYREQPSYGPGGGQPRFGLPRLTPMVKYLLIVNCAVFILQLIYRKQALPGEIPTIEKWFAAINGHSLEIWRVITFQFLHGSTGHLFFNMLTLYFFGTFLESSWGGKRFLRFYLICGAVGGSLFLFLSYMIPSFGGILVGASGGLLGLLTACAVLFPQLMVFIFLFPIRIRILVLIYLVLYIFNILEGDNVGGNLCHLGGMATGFVWLMARPYFASLQQKRNKYAQQHNQEQNEKLNYELDRILAKVHEQGIQSLSRSEKQFLQKATQQHKHK